MRVLVACETSGRVREAFAAKGHYALSCDVLPSEVGGNHYQGDVRDVIDSAWDLAVCHPPCTHLSKAGGWAWKFKRDKQVEALDFVRFLLLHPGIPSVAIENPVGKINTSMRKPDQIIHPWMFGDPWMKETCLWLRGLPLLRPTNIVEPQGNWVKPGNKRPHRRFDDMPEGGGGNWKDRSRTFVGIAQAMADQWAEDVCIKWSKHPYYRQSELEL